MSQPEAKRQKTDDGEYELIYWPGIPGRGEFIRLLFEDSGTPYKDTGKGDPSSAVSKVTSLTSSKGDAANPPVFAPPALRHGDDVLIHQTANIMMYLAPKVGLAPTDLVALYHLNAIALTLLDGLSDEVHETHHPIATGQYYEDQKPEAKKRAKAFTEERLPKFLAYVQRVLDGEKSGEGPWLYGGECSYVDLVLFQVSRYFHLLYTDSGNVTNALM